MISSSNNYALSPVNLSIPFVVKSRFHFRRGFDETGYAKTIVIVDATGPFIGTVHLDALPWEKIELTDYYVWGTPRRD